MEHIDILKAEVNKQIFIGSKRSKNILHFVDRASCNDSW